MTVQHLLCRRKHSLIIIGNEEAWNRSEAEGLRNLVNNDTFNYFEVERVKAEVKQISDAYTQGLKDIEEAYSTTTKKRKDLSEEELTLFAKTV